MRIAVNTRLLLKDKLEGIGWFAYETLRRIVKEHEDVEFTFFFDRKYSEKFVFNKNVQPEVVFPPARHPLLYHIWFQNTLKKKVVKGEFDLFLSPDGYLPLNIGTKSVIVIHDLNFEHYPNDLPALERYYYRKYFPKFATKANRVATVSHFSKSDIVKQYNVSADKIDVVYNGCNEDYKPLSKQLIEETKSKYTKGCDYFLFVGALHPRKNLANLFKAFDSVKLQGENDVKLLIVGEKKWWTKTIREAYNVMRYKNDVIFTGRLEPKELHKVMGSALALTYVSYFEGFGIPILEAMNCDVPVITSNVTSMPEVAGNAAMLVDPFSLESIANSMQEIMKNEEKREDLVKRGREQREKFSWDRTATLLWNTIEKSIES